MSPTARDPRDVLAELIETESGTVRVASREAGECVRRTAADPTAFSVERGDDGGWQVRYVGRREVCGCRDYETDTPSLYRVRRRACCPACGARARVLGVDGATVRLAVHRQRDG